MNILLAIAAASALAAGATGNNDRAAQPQAESRHAEAPEAQEPRRMCRMTVDSASRLGRRRVCLTADQWRARDDN
jgi:hypothetical protein